jgi:hypothetical protein
MRHYRAVEEGRWWSIPVLANAIHDAVVEALTIEGMDQEMAWLNAPDQDLDRYFQEFYRALLNGVFGLGRRSRVLMVSPEFGSWRLTPERAKGVVEKSGWNEFAQRYAMYAWIEIDRVEAWLWTWLDERNVKAWVSTPRIQEARGVARKALHRAPIEQTLTNTAAPTAVIDPFEVEVLRWFSPIVADCLKRRERLTKESAFKLAMKQYPQISGYWFYTRIYRPPTIPEEWTQRGRPKGSRNKKGK